MRIETNTIHNTVKMFHKICSAVKPIVLKKAQFPQKNGFDNF